MTEVTQLPWTRAAAVDMVTTIVKRAIDSLFVLNPRGTSIGVFAGIAAHGTWISLYPSLIANGRSFDQPQVYHFIAVGIVVFNLPSIFRRRTLPDEIEDAFEAIRRLRGVVPKTHLKLQYLALCADIVERTRRPPTAQKPA